MGAVLAFQMQLATEECCVCGTPFAMASELQRRAREKGESFYCPSGHRQSYSKSEVQRLTEQRDRALREKQDAEREAEFQRTLREQERLNHAKAERKLKRRLGAGTCPCCQRTFSQLAQHMAEKHPEMAPPAAVKSQAKRKAKP